jgi:hypothetical protein
LLKIFQNYVMKLQKNLFVSLPGFLLCMLPALEDQSPGLRTMIDAIFEETEKIVGTSAFIGEIWKTILRTPRTRLPGIKFLDRKVPKDVTTASRRAKDGQVYASNYYQVVVDGTLVVDYYDPKSGKAPPDWAREEQDMLLKLQSGNDCKDAFFGFFYPKKT